MKKRQMRNVASRAFDDATTSLQIAIDNNDMTGIRVAKDLLDSAKKRFEEVKAHREEQSKIPFLKSARVYRIHCCNILRKRNRTINFFHV